MKKKIFLMVEYQDEEAYKRANAGLMKIYRHEGISIMVHRELRSRPEIAKEKHYHYKTKAEHKIVRYTEILFFQKNLRKMRIYTTRGIDEFYGKINEVVSNLDMDEFIMPHRSFIVNKNRVIRANRHTIFIEGSEEQIPISKRYRKRVYTALKSINICDKNALTAE